jgi:D-glycero-D-manno-heptose 1,7-bisphosphate phosphatase
MLDLKNITPNYTLFLDRDGVINHEKQNDYINNWDEFVFYEAALDAIKILSIYFKYIIIVTNQKGVGKGITKQADLETIHQNMQAEIKKNGGKVDAIFYCSDLENDSPNRKPQIGMGLQAKAHFPEIDFSKTIMVGNRMSDMQFGKNLGIYTVYLTTTHPDIHVNNTLIDASFDSLISFAKAIN